MYESREKDPDNNAQDDLNLHILHMFKGTGSLDATHRFARRDPYRAKRLIPSRQLVLSFHVTLFKTALLLHLLNITLMPNGLVYISLWTGPLEWYLACF